MTRRIPQAARLAEAAGLLIGAVAIVENARSQVVRIVGLTASEVGGECEAKLLQESRRYLPRLPFERIDVLVVDRMGKDISGAGMDTNVINRYRIIGQEDRGSPLITAIVAMDLTNASHGNATGLGNADFIPIKVLRKVDFEASYANAITGGQIGITRMKVPITMANARDAIRAAVTMCGIRSGGVKLAWIHDTLSTEVFAASSALLAESAEVRVLGRQMPLPFSRQGGLKPLLKNGSVQFASGRREGQHE